VHKVRFSISAYLVLFVMQLDALYVMVVKAVHN